MALCAYNLILLTWLPLQSQRQRAEGGSCNLSQSKRNKVSLVFAKTQKQGEARYESLGFH